jgi:hypothetical protein
MRLVTSHADELLVPLGLAGPQDVHMLPMLHALTARWVCVRPCLEHATLIVFLRGSYCAWKSGRTPY